jgi:hypothetical protein
MANRQERRTKGKWIIKRLQILKNSQLLKDADLSDLPKDVVDKLIAGTCEQKDLQTRYKKCMKIISEITELELMLQQMKQDLAFKKGVLSQAPQENVVDVD